jgi:predicted N-acetyltransferase YhbS
VNSTPAFSVCRWTSDTRLEDILAVVHAAFAGLEPPSSVLKETVADLAARQRDGVVLAAQAGSAFVCSVFGTPKDDGLYLARLAVTPSWRQRGVAGALLAATDDEARRIGASRLTLRVRVCLPDNLSYFHRAGFVVTGQGQDPGRSPYYALERALEPAA